ncbi:hypothetical protein ACS0TY_021653 [Phlomoides rotata]
MSAATLYSPLSSALQVKRLRISVLSINPSAVFKPKRDFPSIRAATEFSLSLDTGLITELDSVSSYSEIVPDTVVFDDFERFPPTAATVHDLLNLYREIGVPPERLLFKIPSTWQGIEASRLLESNGIQTHMTFVYSFCQAAAAAQAGASVIQVFVGRLRDWARNHNGDSEVEAALRRGEDPGLALVTKAYNYIHKYGHKSKLMAVAIRNKQDVFNLLGVDYIISPLNILQSLKESVTPPDEKYSLMRRLSPHSAAAYNFTEKELVKWDEHSFALALGPAAVELVNAGTDGYANQSKRVEELFGKIWPPPNV